HVVCQPWAPVRDPPATARSHRRGAVGNGLCGGRRPRRPWQAVTTGDDRCRNIVTAGGGRGRRAGRRGPRAGGRKEAAPGPPWASAHSCPPCASIIRRLIASPSPIPSGLVV